MAPQTAEDHDYRPSVSDSDMRGDVRLANYKIDKLEQKLDTFITEIKNGYATKSDLNVIKEDVMKLENNIGWLVKTVLGVVVVAILGVVVVKAGVRP